MKDNFTSKILNIILIIGIIITIALMVFSPFIIAAFLKVSQIGTGDDFMFYSIVIAFLILALPYVVALIKLRTLSGLASKNAPFTQKSVNSLKIISICAFLEIILFVICANIIKHTFIVFNDVLLTAPTIFIGFICITLGLVFAVLAQLFNKAKELKEENDMTI